MSDKTWTIRRDQWGAATAIELDGRTILHLLAGTKRNESDGGAEMVLALLQAAEKLQKTADGVAVAPGDVVYTADRRLMLINSSASGHIVSECYSTCEAVRADLD